METTPSVVNEEVTTPLGSDPATEVVVKEGTTATVPPGAKTESSLLLESLQEERRKRRELEEQLESLTSSSSSDDDVGALKKEVSSLSEKLSRIEEEKSFNEMLSKYPKLKEVSAEFKEYRESEHPRAKLESVAKLFLVEKGLLEPERKGLEDASAGPRVPVESKLSAREIDDLRVKDYRKFKQLLKEGKI